MIYAKILSTTTVTMYPAAKLGNQSMLFSFLFGFAYAYSLWATLYIFLLFFILKFRYELYQLKKAEK